MMDDLYCLESDVENDDVLEQSYTSRGYDKRLYHMRTAKKDPTFLTDRCFENLLKSESAPQITGYAAKEITEDMRRIVATWMLEVSQNFAQIFLSAIFARSPTKRSLISADLNLLPIIWLKTPPNTERKHLLNQLILVLL